MRGLTAIAAAMLVVLAARSAAALEGFRLLKLDGHYVKWGGKTFGAGATVTYALVRSPVQFPAARNCARMTSPAAMLARLDISQSRFLREVRAAFDLWSRAADITFLPADDPASAQILIGVQAVPRGRAFTNVDYKREDGGGPRTITRSLICLNPQAQWKIGFDGNLDVYDLRYTIAHEIGHAIGLDHPPIPDALMDYRYQERFRAPQAADIGGALLLYGAPRYVGTGGSRNASAGTAGKETGSARSAGSPDLSLGRVRVRQEEAPGPPAVAAP